jgi:predicted HicB family RNase H-like nuclease
MTEPRSVLDFAGGKGSERHYSAKLPEALWKRAHIYAMDHRITLNELIMMSLEKYVDETSEERTKDSRIP